MEPWVVRGRVIRHLDPAIPDPPHVGDLLSPLLAAAEVVVLAAALAALF